MTEDEKSAFHALNVIQDVARRSFAKAEVARKKAEFDSKMRSEMEKQKTVELEQIELSL